MDFKKYRKTLITFHFLPYFFPIQLVTISIQKHQKDFVSLFRGIKKKRTILDIAFEFTKILLFMDN